MKRLLLGALFALAACGDPARVEVHDTGRAPTWVHDADVVWRTLNTFDVAVKHWGGAPPQGVKILLVDRMPTFCDHLLGCTLLDDSGEVYVATYIDVWNAKRICVEESSLAHEVGHVVLGGDAHHTDPRWTDKEFWHGMGVALRDIVPPDDTACLSVLETRFNEGS